MAWNEVNKMKQRKEFIREIIEGNSNFSELCREYGISRETGYKWKKRYEENGNSGLEDLRSRPHTLKDATAAESIIEIVKVRQEHPTWGGRTIVNYLKRRKDILCPIPCSRTVDRILKRAGFVTSRSSYKRKIYTLEKVIRPEKTNQVWTVDFKGWWLTKDGKRCEPLTVRDEYSKFIIGTKALSGTKQMPVKECFIEYFDKYGLPDYIRSDNGQPFACPRSLHKLTKLSAWWIKLGITPNRIPPSSPQHNGAHERMHRDIKQELQCNPASNLRREQLRFDAWRHEFNHERPHQALNDSTPAEIYKASCRKYSEPGDYVYPVGFEYRKVSEDGDVFIHNKKINLTKALTAEMVGIDKIEKDLYRVWFRDFYLGIIDFNKSRKIIPDVILNTPLNT